MLHVDASMTVPPPAGLPLVESPKTGGLVLLYEQHRSEILRFLRARTGNPAEAEDVVQELWIKVQAGDSGPVANGRAYLFRMAHNLVLDRLREQRRRQVRDGSWSVERSAGVTADGDLVDPGQGTESELVVKEDLARLATAIEQLPAGARRAFCLHKLDGLSHSEVAARLGISRSGVEKHVALAMQHLRKALKD
jgi:RNA polymerase sigma factor (sigma-70 family)